MEMVIYGCRNIWELALLQPLYESSIVIVKPWTCVKVLWAT